MAPSEFRTLVAEDGVFDRGAMSHAVNLFEMDQKYADVQTPSALLECLGTQDRSAA